jgi:colanic acid/amylovoran biosynthesis glycosyltransferase
VPSVVYVTARLPFGDGEPFVATEVRALERVGWDVTVVPVRGSGEIVHEDARDLKAVSAPLVSRPIVRAAAAEMAGSLRAAGASFATVSSSRPPRVLVKNVSVLPKAYWLARLATRLAADHIHAHWAGTSSTMALVASRLSGIPWSLTAHRWDIAENNLLRAKAGEASFVRAISEHGAAELRQLVGDPAFSPVVLYMGVELPAGPFLPSSAPGPLRILTAARLVEKKGHAVLIEAVRTLRSRGVPVRVDLAGAGPLESRLRDQVRQSGLDDDVLFLGTVSHCDLLARLRAGEWDVTALPSVVTASGELEGIPVSLLEAMACAIPVVGTPTGGTPELLDGGAGLLVHPGDAHALAEGVEKLARDEELRATLGLAGRRRVEERFDVRRVAAELAARFAEGTRAQAFKSA